LPRAKYNVWRVEDVLAWLKNLPTRRLPGEAHPNLRETAEAATA
jgi:hypothetical protein